MKFIKTSIFLIAILLLQYAMLNAQDKYEYPLNSGMPEWKSLPIEEKNKMLQIPEDKLKSMPTEVLI